MLSTVFQPLDLFPEVLGACGGVYLAEAVGGGGGGDGGDLGAPSAAEAMTGGQGGGFARWTGRVSEAYSAIRMNLHTFLEAFTLWGCKRPHTVRILDQFLD